MEAGFMRVVEVGQYFMTKNNGDFKQFRLVACREYTLPRDDPASQPKGWIPGDMRIGPVLEVTTSYMYGKHGIKIRIWSVSQDNSDSWVRIFYGTVKHVIDSNHNNTEIPADPLEAQTSQTNVKVIASRSKATAKPQKRESVDTQLPYRCMKENGLTLIHQNNLSKRKKSRRDVISLLRHNQSVQREEDGAIQFWRIKFHLRNQFSEVQHWSDERWKVCLAAGGGSNRKMSVLL